MNDFCEIRIYNPALEWVAVCATAESVRFERDLYGAGVFEIHIHPDKIGALELTQRGNFIVIDGRPEWSGIVRNFTVSEDREKSEFIIFGQTCNGILGQRNIEPPPQSVDPAALGWDRFSGDVESAMKHYVERHVVNTSEANRSISLLTVANNQNRGQSISWQARYSKLLHELENIGKYAEVGFVVTADIAERRLVFDTIFGTDRTRHQDIVSPVSFNIEYQNVENYTYSEDYTEYATTAFVGGQGENENRRVITIGNEYAGLERFETFIDCRNATTDDELLTMGSQKLAELTPVKNVEATALPRVFVAGKDFFLGDLVTLHISRLGLEIAARVTSVSEIWERERGHVTEVRFGQRLPNIFSVLLRKDLVM